MRVVLFGIEHPFGESLKALLRQRGIEAFVSSEILEAGRPLRNMRRLMSMDILHYLQGRMALRYQWVHALRRKPTIVHWSGTDILIASRGGAKARLRRWFLRHSASLHLADSEDLARESACIAGYEPEVVRLLPVSLKSPVLPMPDKPAVLSYWRKGREEFYGRGVVLQLAEAFPEVEFIASVDVVPPREQWGPNVTYEERRPTLEHLWPRVGCLIRVIKHDSLSAMVLEAMFRGRHVIYSKPFPHTRQATDFEEARQALSEILADGRANQAGAEFVNERFDPEVEADKVVAAYNRVLKK